MSDAPLEALASSPPTSRGDYVVVARRYRPQAFEQLVGQEHVARALSNAITTSRVGHAYLFSGARGVGKTSTARILAKALNCVEGPTPAPCNACEICQAVSSGDDVDVLEIDGASNRRIEEMRNLRQNVSIRPSRARFKIYIIDEVHMLTNEAFNALLKTLEEPPEHVKFIFCTTEPEKIPITILSRCQRFDFAGIQAASITERLRQIVETEGVEAEDEALAILARRAGGSMRDSQSLLEQLLAFGGSRISVADVHAMLGTAADGRLSTLAGHLVERNAAAALADLDEALAEGVDVGQLTDQLVGYFRDVMAAAVGCSPQLFLHASPAEQSQIVAAGRKLGLETVLAVLQILDQALARMRVSTHRRTLAELAVVRICALEDLSQIQEVVERLRDGLPKRASGDHLAASGAAQPVGPKKKAEPSSDGPNGNGAAAPPNLASELTGSPATTPENGAEEGHQSPQAVFAPAEVWQQALARLGDAMVSELAAPARVLAISAPNRLVVSFPAKYNSHKAFCQHPEQLAKLEKVVSELAGGPVRVELLLEESAAEEPQPARKPPLRARAIDKSSHPMVERAEALFGARTVAVEAPEE